MTYGRRGRASPRLGRDDELCARRNAAPVVARPVAGFSYEERARGRQGNR